GGVADRLQEVSDGRVFRVKSDRSAGQADFGQAGAERILASDECGTSGSAALLAVIISESNAFFSNAVNVGSLVSHHASAEVTDIPHADVIAPENQDVRLLCSHDLFLPLIDFLRLPAMAGKNVIRRNARIGVLRGPFLLVARRCPGRNCSMHLENSSIFRLRFRGRYSTEL